MNKRTILSAGALAVTALLGITIGRYFPPAGDEHPPSDATAATGAGEETAAPDFYTCSMHPQIQQPEPGDCPICGMDLIPAGSDDGNDLGPREMSMSPAAKALAEIRTSRVTREFPEASIRMVGKLDYDETLLKSLSARFPARIDELFVNFTGIPVEKGQHLARVYSPELLSAQRELLSAHERDPDGAITRAAREKLRLWDLLPEQIDAIIASGEAKDNFVLRAPIGGVVVAKNVKEGDYVQTGEPLFKIADLGDLWLFLDAYESDLPWLRYGQDVAFTVEALPGETFHGRIVFIEPEVDRKTRTIPVRVNVPNPERRLKPGMFVRGTVEAKLAEDGGVFAPDMAGKWISPMHPEIVKNGPGQCDVCGMDLVPAEKLGYVEIPAEEAPLVIPSSAVLRTGKRAVVYIEKPDTERPTYEGREIVLGPRAGELFVVSEGLEEGDRVVTNGAFKIDSALQIQAKPSMMSPGDQAASAPGDKQSSVTIELETAKEILPPYLDLQTALAADELETAKDALRTMMESTGHKGPLPNLIHRMLAAESLDAMRKPHFDTLSSGLIAAVRKDPASFDRTLHLMHCPMVYGETGADWLQAGEELRNPYFGAMMLLCGEVRETFETVVEKGE